MNRLGDNDKVSWMTSRSAASSRVFAKSSGWNTGTSLAGSSPILDIVEAETSVSGTVDAAVIATAPLDHEADLKSLLARFSPSAALVEKPFAPNAQAAQSMLATAEKHGTQLFVNFEFRLASYVGAAASAVNGLQPATISMDWGDNAAEIRPDGPKTAEWGTHIAQDQGSHVWSLLDRLAPGYSWLATVADLSPLPDHLALTVHGRPISDKNSDGVTGVVRLSRRSARRRRHIEFTSVDGQELTLDFAVEPGNLVVNGTRIDLKSEWASTPRPLSCALDILLKAAEAATTESTDLIRAKGCLDAVSFAASAELACLLAARSLIEAATSRTKNITAVLTDFVAPTLATLGIRIDLSRPESHEELANFLWNMRSDV